MGDEKRCGPRRLRIRGERTTMVPLGMGCCDHHVGMGRMECRETGGTGIGMLGLEGGCPWTSIFEPGLGRIPGCRWLRIRMSMMGVKMVHSCRTKMPILWFDVLRPG
ncbi:unnamed protein product [Musa acuminata subsp. burmannicoides]